MSNPMTTPTQDPTRAEILRVTFSPKLIEAARGYLLVTGSHRERTLGEVYAINQIHTHQCLLCPSGSILSYGYRDIVAINAHRCSCEDVADAYEISAPKLRLAVRVLRHLDRQKQQHVV